MRTTGGLNGHHAHKGRNREKRNSSGAGRLASAQKSSANSPSATHPALLSRVVPATAGDHPDIHDLLVAVFHAPSRDGFYSSLDDPFYEPCDRLLVKRGPRIIAHVHLTERAMHLGREAVPVAGLSWLATLPEFRGLGFGRQILAAAQSAMAAGGAALGVLNTRQPDLFLSQGWVICGRHDFVRAGSRDLLAQLSARGLPPANSRLRIRPLRQVELPGLMDVYQHAASRGAGAFERTEAYWRWLLSRKGFNNILVALGGPDKLDLGEAGSPIVGYAVTREDRVLELVASAQHPTAAEELLARACSEAIERGHHSLELHAPPGDRLRTLFREAGGAVFPPNSHGADVYMARLFNPLLVLRKLCCEILARAEDARLNRPCELGLLIDDERYLVSLTRRSVKIVPNRLGRSYLRLSRPDATRLMLGQYDVAEAAAAGKLNASTRTATEMARVLFPRRRLWRPPWDDLCV